MLFFCRIQIMSYLCNRKSERRKFSLATLCTTYRGVEQLVARQAHKLEVACSSPAPTTKTSDGLQLTTDIHQRRITRKTGSVTS